MNRGTATLACAVLAGSLGACASNTPSATATATTATTTAQSEAHCLRDAPTTGSRLGAAKCKPEPAKQ